MTPSKSLNKPGSLAKAPVNREDDADGDHLEDKQSTQAQSGSGPGGGSAIDNDGDEPYGEGEAFDDEDKAEGNGGRERRKIEIKFIQNKARRHITFSKRKHGIMKKAWELSVLTGTQVLLLVVSETGLVYTFTTPKLQPLVTQNEGKNLIQACLNAPESPADGNEDSPEPDQVGSEGEVSPPSGAANDHRATDTPAHMAALRKSHDAQNHMAAHNGQIHGAGSPSVAANSQEGLSPQPAGHAAAVRAAMQAQAQAIAVSGFPPHLQQFAPQGYKVPPGNPQYYQGYPYSPGVGGQFGSQMPNISGQFPSGAPLDTSALMAMQPEGLQAPNGEYTPIYPQAPPPHQPGKN